MGELADQQGEEAHVDGGGALAAERGTWREFSAAVTRLLEPAPHPAPS